MGVRERHEDVARKILDAARELFVAEGYRNVSIRKVAERVKYSPAAIYSYFSSKDDIFLALAEEGFRTLFTSKPSVAPSTPIEAIRAGFWHVYLFSKSHPEYYALMFLDRSVPRISADWERFGFVRDMKIETAGLIRRAIDSGEFPPGTDPQAVFRILFAAIHGAAAMCLCDRLEPGADSDALARDTLEAALVGLRTGFTLSIHPADSCN